MRSIWTGVAAAAIAVVSLGLARPAPAQEISVLPDQKVRDAVLGDGLANEPGRWKSKVVQALIPGTNRLETHEYLVFDFEPARDLDFLWLPANPASDRSGKISGAGRVVWREHGRLAWDAAGVVKSYTGDMSQGRPEGEGELVTREGLTYSGGWRVGRLEGKGTLQLPGGESYVGEFRAGFADGHGDFIDATGERFEGTFRNGRREGRGKTILPSGFSYTSVWTAGKEEPGSQRIRLAQLSGSAAGAGGNDIRLGVTVQRKPDLPREVNIENVISYGSTPQGQTIRVAPANKDLVNAWKGNGDIQSFDNDSVLHRGIFYFDPKYVQSTIPTFLLNLDNRSSEKIDITALRIDVLESRQDNEPAIHLVDLQGVCAPFSYSTAFMLENYGWSPAKNAKLDYSFGGVGAPGGSIPLGDVADRRRINFDPELARAGVDVARLRQLSNSSDPNAGFPCPGGDLNQCMSALRRNPLFGTVGSQLTNEDVQIFLNTVGQLQYTWLDDQSQYHNKASPYRIRLHLGHFTISAECGEGAAPEPIAVNPIRLKLAGNGYSLPVPFHKTVEAGQTARLTVRVDAEKSSDHVFQFVAVLSNGDQVASRPISLLFFRPRVLPALR
jgi:hypothetical protein